MFHHWVAAVAASVLALSTSAIFPAVQEQAETAADSSVLPSAVTAVHSDYSPQASPSWPRGRSTGERIVRTVSSERTAAHGALAPSAVVQGGTALAHPIGPDAPISSVYGWRTNPTGLGDPVQFHIGQDFAVRCGTPVRAAADGTVTWSGWKGTGGLRVDIDHADGLATAYRHNSLILAQPGDQVAQGDIIALVGTTGNSTGCHLHFEVTVDGTYVNPAHLLPGGRGLAPIRVNAPVTAERPSAPSGASGPAVQDSTRPQVPTTPRTHQREETSRSAQAEIAPRSQRTARSSSPVPGTRSPAASSQASSAQTPAAPSPTRPEPQRPVPHPTPVKEPSAPPAPKPTLAPAASPLDPVQPAPAPTPSAPAAPILPAEPAEPAEPTEPAETIPSSPQPEPAEPSSPAAPATPSEPAEPVAALPPEPLTAAQAAQWCLIQAEEEDSEHADPVAGHLDAEGVPRAASEELLAMLAPEPLWLTELPDCTDQDFLDSAAEVRNEDPAAAAQPRVSEDDEIASSESSAQDEAPTS
ncbi:M23 family metallopeptidase [Micrococcus terreus]|uniref:M23 family metallopeptidase n=1 Tax=Micrococcus terreus TaxID=574650 RepID=UPI00255132B6|nr:peptidoglycan DD-metalloendopeptidase family protein [Micrococcus terreus]MDK7700951.1 peptidoglycan DD-metalloendopeptidase family protein [Micrococcus terreus]WOO97982.1 peptidoglycan DD-metalloendopeptidase family protein [Micrococcus terreus]